VRRNRRELQNIYNEIDRLEKNRDQTAPLHDPFTPLFQWPLLGAFALMALELILSNTRYRRRGP